MNINKNKFQVDILQTAREEQKNLSEFKNIIELIIGNLI